jgi:hypothetical protein
VIANYMATTHQGFGPYYRPHDMYVGNLMTALGCIDAGITCVIDNSHNSRTAAHSDAAIEALFDSGIRAVHASGPPQFGTWDNQWPADLARIQKKYFMSADQLVTLRAFANPNRDNWAFARSLGLKIHADGISSEQIEEFGKANLLAPDFTFNHANNLTDAVWRMVRDTGCNVAVCTRSDAQYALGNGASAGVGGFQKALDFGMQPGPQCRQRNVVQHRHVRRDAGDVFRAAGACRESPCQHGSERAGARDRAPGPSVRDGQRGEVRRAPGQVRDADAG